MKRRPFHRRVESIPASYWDPNQPEGGSHEYEVVALIPCRDGEDSLEKTVLSILRQTVSAFVSVADDASIDKTPMILNRLSEKGRVAHIRNPKREPKDYARVPTLLNMALKISPTARFYMISGDDCTYCARYCESLIQVMRKDKVDVSSGYIGKYNRTSEPSGSGRLITADFLTHIAPFPHSIGWETWILYRAAYLGRKTAVYPFGLEHNRRYSLHSTWTFGQSAYVNGVPLTFTLFRTLRNMYRRELGFFNSLSILLGHVEYFLRRVRKLDTANFASATRRREISNIISALVT